eukprot:TRINITY_DN12322_c0_g2_i1.p1 TRINITY_DN12322_c0_g2~~TRINITY_DN12322_c0_g2_i1.p1  ORF type:complete len:690 (-),score=179.14 TRINITY_DN12322_c0_g2_i1:113-2182(-)
MALRKPINLNKIFPPKPKFFIYQGSDTTPPCEPTIWMIAFQTGSISHDQLNDFPKTLVYKVRAAQAAQPEIFITFLPGTEGQQEGEATESNTTETQLPENDRIEEDDVERGRPQMKALVEKVSSKTGFSNLSPFRESYNILGDSGIYEGKLIPDEDKRFPTKYIDKDDVLIVQQPRFVYSVDEELLENVISKLTKEKNNEREQRRKSALDDLRHRYEEAKNRTKPEEKKNEKENEKSAEKTKEKEKDGKKTGKKGDKRQGFEYIHLNENEMLAPQKPKRWHEKPKKSLKPRDVVTLPPRELHKQPELDLDSQMMSAATSFNQIDSLQKDLQSLMEQIPSADNESEDQTTEEEESYPKRKRNAQEPLSFLQMERREQRSLKPPRRGNLYDMLMEKGSSVEVPGGIYDEENVQTSSKDKPEEEVPSQRPMKFGPRTLPNVQTRVMVKQSGKGSYAYDRHHKWDGIEIHETSSWPDLCKVGQFQSPINIDASIQFRPEANGLRLNYSRATENAIVLRNDGYKFTVEGSFGEMFYGTHRFFVHEIQIHHPSEHTFGPDHTRADFEVQIVHEDDFGLKAIIAILFMATNEGEENQFFANLAFSPRYDYKFPEGQSKLLSSKFVDLSMLLPEVEHFIMYEGSLTSPPCSEIVTWFLVQEKFEVKEEQVKQFEIALGIKSNIRGVQPLGSRILKLY